MNSVRKWGFTEFQVIVESAPISWKTPIGKGFFVVQNVYTINERILLYEYLGNDNKRFNSVIS